MKRSLLIGQSLLIASLCLTAKAEAFDLRDGDMFLDLWGMGEVVRLKGADNETQARLAGAVGIAEGSMSVRAGASYYSRFDPGTDGWDINAALAFRPWPWLDVGVIGGLDTKERIADALYAGLEASARIVQFSSEGDRLMLRAAWIPFHSHDGFRAWSLQMLDLGIAVRLGIF